MSQAFERACEPHRANISGLRFHDLRHEATSRLFEKGLNVMEVAAITGHKTLDMLKRYTHLRAEDLAKKLGYSRLLAGILRFQSSNNFPLPYFIQRYRVFNSR